MSKLFLFFIFSLISSLTVFYFFYCEDDEKGTGNLDLVFVVDNTGSMGVEIEVAKERINSMIDSIKALPLMKGILKVGLNIRQIKKFVDSMEAEGGNDFPEAVAEAFYETVRINWRKNSNKLIIWIADAPPHEKNSYDWRRNWEPQVENLREIGVIVHSVLVRNHAFTYNVMKKVSKQTKGVVINLKHSNLIEDITVGLAADGLDRHRISEIVNNHINTTSIELITK